MRVLMKRASCCTAVISEYLSLLQSIVHVRALCKPPGAAVKYRYIIYICYALLCSLSPNNTK